MSDSRGIVYIAYGDRARRSVARAVESAREFTQLPVAIVGDIDPRIEGAQFIGYDSEHTGRLAKLNLDTLSPYDYTLYLDADTRIKSRDICRGFSILAAGYDVVMAHSENQGIEFLSHSTPTDREQTRVALGNLEPMQLQAGVIFFVKNSETAALWSEWRNEWRNAGGGQDQGALLRALDKAPLKLWVLSLDWNSRNGSIVEHHFGEAR